MLHDQIDGAIRQDPSFRTNDDQDLRRHIVSPSAEGVLYPIHLKPKSKLFFVVIDKIYDQFIFRSRIE